VRVDKSRLNKRTVEALVKAGAFDNLQRNRAALVASIDQAFEFAAAAQANVNQGGLFDADPQATQEPPLVRAMPWGVKAQLGFEKTAIGFYLSGHLFDEVEREVRQFAKRRIADLVDSRESQLLAAIVTDLRVVNGQRGKIVIFKLDDKSAAVEATVDEALYNLNRHLFKDDELVVVQGLLQPDRFSGGFRFKVAQVWDLESARCRFGKYLHLAINGSDPDIARLVREFPARRQQSEEGERVQGLPLRLSVFRNGASAELQLGEAARIYPSDAALASAMAQADKGRAQIVYE
jgi:DNA polymerase-3 subunit alpha